MSLSEIAFEVCTALDRAGVLAVLVGGSAAAYHAPKASMTEDLDFVVHLELFGIPSGGVQALRDLGFQPTRAKGTLAHEAIRYTLEILDGPLAVGAEDVETWDTHRQGDRVLYVISPTVSVKDRLAHAIHFHDLSAAKQAAQIAKLSQVDLSDVASWCANVGGSIIYAYFETFLNTVDD
jgi:hypothetical protein